MTPERALELIWDAATGSSMHFTSTFYANLCEARKVIECNLTFDKLRAANIKRCVEGFKHPLDSWSIAEWGNAAGGEYGEALESMLIAIAAGAALGRAQNTAKKILRFRDGVAGNKKTREEYLKDLASEIAGTLIYLDLWAASEGLDTAQIVRDEFNKKSEDIDYPGRI